MSTTIPDRSPGQIAYDAYCQSVNFRSVHGEALPMMRTVMVELARRFEESAADIRKGLNEIKS